jgi:pimeloyl-ACP methyl ester carboxylesterase
MMRAIQTKFKPVNILSPKFAGRLALLLFSYPFKSGRLNAAEQRLVKRADQQLERATRHVLQVNGEMLAAWEFAAPSSAPTGTVLLVHGWMSGARHMMALANALWREGYRVICFDLPAHGDSGGRTTNLSRCAAGLRHLIRHFGPVDTVIAHSFGGVVTAWAFTVDNAAAQLGDGHIILLASPNRLSSVTSDFARQLGILQSGQSAFEAQLCSPLDEALNR